MKIGVLTYHIDMNPGATLQCYATCRALQELGHEIYIIDLEHRSEYNSKIREIVAKILQRRSMYRQMKFIHEYFPPFTRHYSDIDELRDNPPQLDAYCIGSDQVWNTKIAGPSHMAYFLDFGEEKVKRFSYASSIGLDEWPVKDESENKRIGTLLSGYDGLAVREPTAAMLLRDQFGLEATIVCDPVLLHKDYGELIGPQKQSGEMSCYMFKRPTEVLEALLKVAKDLGVPARMVTSLKPINGFIHTTKKEVPMWLKYMSSSVFNVTDSFHGTVVSLLYHRPFAVVYKDDGRSSRISDLLKSVGLEDRMFFNVEDFRDSKIWHKSIDWSDVDARLEEHRVKSWDYLKKTLDRK